MTGACRGSVLFIVQIGLPIYCRVYAQPVVCKCNCLWPTGLGARGMVQSASTWAAYSLPVTGGKELKLTGELGQTILAWLFCIPLPFNLMTSRREQGAMSKAELKSVV